MQNKLTRKQFLLSILSAFTLVAVGNFPKIIQTIAKTKIKKGGSSYGNSVYGGSKKNI